MTIRRSIRSQLAILVLITIVPVLLLLVVATYAEVQEETAQARDTGLHLAQLTAANMEQWLQETEVLLSGVSERPAVKALNPDLCDSIFGDLTELFPQYIGIGTVDREGNIVCSVNAMDELLLTNVSNREWFREVMRSASFTVGDVQLDRSTQQWVSVLAYPIFGEQSELVGAIILPIDLFRYQTSLSHVSLPPGGAITIIDEHGTVVARSSEFERWVGMNARGMEVADLVLAKETGQTRARGLDGVDRLYGFTTIDGANWHVYVGIPAAEAMQPAHTAVVRYFVLSITVVALVAIVAWYFRGQIVEPLYQMANVAGAVAAGELDRRAPVVGPRELAEVARQFNKMVAVRAEHTAQLERQARELATLIEMGQAVASSLDLQVVLERVLDQVSLLVPGEGISIILLEGDTLRLAAANGPGLNQELGDRRPARSGLAGQVIENGEAILVNDEVPYPHLFREPTENDGFKVAAVLSVPLTLRGSTLGVVEAVHSQHDVFNEHDLQMLEAASTWIAIAIGNARLYQEEFRAHRLADALRTANVALSESLDPNIILERLLMYAHDLVAYDQAFIALPEEDDWVIHALVPFPEEQDNVAPVYEAVERQNLPYLERVSLSREAQLVLSPSRQLEMLQPTESTKVIDSWMGVPLLANDDVTGILSLQRHDPPTFTETDLRLMEALVAQASVALQNAHLFEEVRSSREQLHRLTQQLMSAQENERRRLSQELHDDAGQMLTALQLNLGLIRSRVPDDMIDVQESIEEVAALAGETMDRLRWLSQDLRPPALQHTTLLQAIEGLCQDFAHRTQITIYCDGEEIPSLPDDLSLSLYRFVQEALTNAAKHADASEVGVALRFDKNEVYATVADNGRGFNVQEKMNGSGQGRHFGLMGMRERLQLLGGRLAIDSELGRGTVLAASVPFEREQHKGSSGENNNVADY